MLCHQPHTCMNLFNNRGNSVVLAPNVDELFHKENDVFVSASASSDRTHVSHESLPPTAPPGNHCTCWTHEKSLALLASATEKTHLLSSFNQILTSETRDGVSPESSRDPGCSPLASQAVWGSSTPAAALVGIRSTCPIDTSSSYYSSIFVPSVRSDLRNRPTGLFLIRSPSGTLLLRCIPVRLLLQPCNRALFNLAYSSHKSLQHHDFDQLHHIRIQI